MEKENVLNLDSLFLVSIEDEYIHLLSTLNPDACVPIQLENYVGCYVLVDDFVSKAIKKGFWETAISYYFRCHTTFVDGLTEKEALESICYNDVKHIKIHNKYDAETSDIEILGCLKNGKYIIEVI